MGGQYHIGNAVRSYCIGMSFSIIEKLMYLVHGVFCRRGLSYRNGSKCREHCGINGSGVVGALDPYVGLAPNHFHFMC